ncbi:MAG TPA: class I SAM-dependent methyltransferase [Vicinamibacterales bacterium]|nr:class I SAM-dependent methyltransferase [Vicinamibacterales bacterium]
MQTTETISGDDVAYDRFIADVYDSSPYFGQGKARELEKFNAPYFRRLAGRTGRILEFGSGTGMLTVPLARAGYQIDSVDISPFMHDVLTRKLQNEEPRVLSNVNQILSDATTYIGPEPYNSIVMPEGILIALPSVDLQMSLLRSCHRNLAAGGRIHIDFFQPYYKAIYQENLKEFSRFRTPTGETYLLTIEITNDKYSQIQHWKGTYTRVENGESRDSTVVDLDFRYVFYSEIQLMLQLTGFQLIELDTEYADRRGFFLVAERI